MSGNNITLIVKYDLPIFPTAKAKETTAKLIKIPFPISNDHRWNLNM